MSKSAFYRWYEERARYEARRRWLYVYSEKNITVEEYIERMRRGSQKA